MSGLSLFPRLSSAPGPAPSIHFEDAIQGSGIKFRMNNSVTPQKHQVETMLAGVAVLDYNNDGRPDIYLVNGAELPSMDKSDPKFHNRLYRNNGGGVFTAVTEKAGVAGAAYGMGVAAGDHDDDGRIDAVVVTQNNSPEIWISWSPASAHWLILELTGTRSNRDGQGARRS